MTTTERVEHLEQMMGQILALEKQSLEFHGETKTQMDRLLALEERSLEIHAGTRKLLAEQQAQLAEQRKDSKRFHALIARIYKKNGWDPDEDIF